MGSSYHRMMIFNFKWNWNSSVIELHNEVEFQYQKQHDDHKIYSISATFSLLLTVYIKLSPNENWFWMLNGSWNSLRLCLVFFKLLLLFAFDIRLTTTKRKEEISRQENWNNQKALFSFLGSKKMENFPPNFHLLFWSAPSFYVCRGKLPEATWVRSRSSSELKWMENRCGGKWEEQKKEFEV